MPNKKVVVTVDCSTLPPIFTYSDDVDPDDSEIVQVDSNSVESVTWQLKGKNNPLGAVTFAQQNPIVFTGGDQWASGTPPTVVRKSDTKVRIHDHNVAAHSASLVHTYQINVVYNGVGYSTDPEVEEMSSGGPLAEDKS